MRDANFDVAVADILEQVRERLADERRHCRGAEALDIFGYECAATDPEAQRWCLSGAVMAIVGARCDPYGDAALDELLHAMPIADRCKGIPWMNDTHQHTEVLALIDRAIACLQSDRGV